MGVPCAPGEPFADPGEETSAGRVGPVPGEPLTDACAEAPPDSVGEVLDEHAATASASNPAKIRLVAQIARREVMWFASRTFGVATTTLSMTTLGQRRMCRLIVARRLVGRPRAAHCTDPRGLQ